jgi:MATE family multidrug resistance protein
MSGHASVADLAAVAIGSSLWIPLLLFISGILIAITPIVAQYCGAKQYQHIGHTVRQSCWIGALLAILSFVLLFYSHHLFIVMAIKDPVLTISTGYLHAIAWGMPAIIGFLILRYLNEGMTNILPIMLIGIFGLGVNIISNYLLIFGHFGFPKLGGVGAGWATTFSHFMMFMSLFIYTLKSHKLRKIKLFKLSYISTTDHNKPLTTVLSFIKVIQPNIIELKRLLTLGLPIGINFFVEGSIFSIIALFLASMGVVTVAAHQIALNFSSLIFIFPLSLSIALAIQVGHQKGAGQYQLLRDTIKASYLLSLTVSISAALLIINFSTELATFYSNDPQVIQLASHLMIFTALYQVSDGLQLCSSGSLRGLKETKIPMLISIVAYWLIGFPLGYLLALTDIITEPMGAQGFWIGLLIGLTVSAILMSLTLYKRLQNTH